MAGTLHEKVYPARCIGFVPELYADLDYAGNGTLIITREHEAVEPTAAATPGSKRFSWAPSFASPPTPPSR